MASRNEIAKSEVLMITPEQVQSMIREIRGERVILDRDLAILYGVETRELIQAVKRNIERFPEDFMFQLNNQEFIKWKSQFVTSNADKMGLRRAPYAFTEEGVAMLSGLLRSPIAIKVNIQIMRAFVYMKNAILAINQTNLRQEKLELEVKELKSYVEDILRDQNDINEEVSAQMEVINQSLIEMNVQIESLNSKPKSNCRPIGYEAIKNDYKTKLK